MKTWTACEVVYDGTLGGLFALLDRFWAAADWPRQVRRQVYPGGPVPGFPAVPQTGLFDDEVPAAPQRAGNRPDSAGSGTVFCRNSLSSPGLLPDPAALDGAVGILSQVSVDAYDALVCAWMSDFPVEGEALRYGLRVLAAAKEAVPTAIPWYTSEEARRKAAIAAQNRGDNDCRTVLAASYKVAHEINRLMGFLRFKPDAGGYYVARCSPDHFILPVLEPHFTRRFGDTPWAVVDEKRGLALVREGQDSRILLTGEAPLFREGGRVSQRPEPQNRGPWTHDPWAQDPWEELWQSYHRTISIGVRKNPALQRRFIPQRYRDYLNEFNDPPVCSAGTEDPSGSRQPES